MALELKLTYVQQKDNKAVILTDATGTYSVDNTTGWGTPNPEITGIDGATHTLEMDIVKKGIDGDDTTYDTIDLFTEFGPFTAVGDLVFTLTPNMLLQGSTAQGTSDDEWLDGVYEFTYTYDKGLGTEVSLTGTLLIDGVVRTSIDKLLSEIPTVYNCKNYRSPKIDYALFAYSYLKAMDSSAYLARTDDILRSLETLEKIVLNGNNAVN